MFEEGVEASVFGDQRLGRFFADSGNAGDVVGGIAPERKDVDDPVRGNAERFADGLFVEEDFLGRVENPRRLVDQLKEVLVGRDDAPFRILPRPP